MTRLAMHAKVLLVNELGWFVEDTCVVEPQRLEQASRGSPCRVALRKDQARQHEVT